MGQKKVNQDGCLSLANFCYPNYHLHVVCDGHGPNGHMIYTLILERFPAILTDHLKLVKQQSDQSILVDVGDINLNLYINRWDLRQIKQKRIKKALADSFIELQKNIESLNEFLNSELSGSTLSVVLTTDEDFIYTANVGDSQVLLFIVDRKMKEINENIADKEDK